MTREINIVEQLQKINLAANELLDILMRWNRGDDEALQVLESQVRKVRAGRGENAEKITEYRFKGPRELALKTMQEIRAQINSQLEILQALYDFQAAKQFQDEVLEIIGNASPEIRDEIIRTLRERDALWSALDHDKGALDG